MGWPRPVHALEQRSFAAPFRAWMNMTSGRLRSMPPIAAEYLIKYLLQLSHVKVIVPIFGPSSSSTSTFSWRHGIAVLHSFRAFTTVIGSLRDT